MKVVPLKNYNRPDLIKSLVKEHLEINRLPKNGYVLVKDQKPLGYAIYKKRGSTTIYLDWIWAPGYGTYFLKKLEALWKKQKYHKVLLNLSIDPTEKKESVLRRINFYLKHRYRAIDLKFRPKYGPLLLMEKKLT